MNADKLPKTNEETVEFIDKIKARACERLAELKSQFPYGESFTKESLTPDNEAIWDFISMPEMGGNCEEFFNRQDAFIENLDPVVRERLDAMGDLECVAFWAILDEILNEESNDFFVGLFEDLELEPIEE